MLAISSAFFSIASLSAPPQTRYPHPPHTPAPFKPGVPYPSRRHGVSVQASGLRVYVTVASTSVFINVFVLSSHKNTAWYLFIQFRIKIADFIVEKRGNVRCWEREMSLSRAGSGRGPTLKAAGVGAACQWKVTVLHISLTLTPSTDQIINTVGTSHSYLCKA